MGGLCLSKEKEKKKMGKLLFIKKKKKKKGQVTNILKNKNQPNTS